MRLSDSPLRTVCVHPASFGAEGFGTAPLLDGAGVVDVIAVLCVELAFGNAVACGLGGLLLWA
jgi:hypothetical protein